MSQTGFEFIQRETSVMILNSPRNFGVNLNIFIFWSKIVVNLEYFGVRLL